MTSFDDFIFALISVLKPDGQKPAEKALKNQSKYPRQISSRFDRTLPPKGARSEKSRMLLAVNISPVAK
ncbi:hypothetical protein ACONUD_11105 [Microbulbifer harenosus]|uniref:Uncharacterized protein n=1 Tax=Microbulbifer harenosus TaxID=2576840 RepID=A0ABY2UG63_9GAMM|nr:hypothetical protein [Microbulbifer harenosus]TLM76633.1 hypothetical protein FDY93_12980 [Microbulbifer harenosus]